MRKWCFVGVWLYRSAFDMASTNASQFQVEVNGNDCYGLFNNMFNFNTRNTHNNRLNANAIFCEINIVW